MASIPPPATPAQCTTPATRWPSAASSRESRSTSSARLTSTLRTVTLAPSASRSSICWILLAVRRSSDSRTACQSLRSGRPLRPSSTRRAGAASAKTRAASSPRPPSPPVTMYVAPSRTAAGRARVGRDPSTRACSGRRRGGRRGPPGPGVRVRSRNRRLRRPRRVRAGRRRSRARRPPRSRAP